MPSKSKYPSISIPNTDLWGFLFERKDKPYPDDKGMNDEYIRRMLAYRIGSLSEVIKADPFGQEIGS